MYLGYGDMLETFMTSRYYDVLEGRTVNDDETMGLLIALLMAGVCCVVLWCMVLCCYGVDYTVLLCFE